MGTAAPSSSLHSRTLQSLGERHSSSQYINLHCQALLHWSSGHFSQAASTWERCLLLYPFDLLSIKFVSDTYFYQGNREMIRDSIARILPFWETSSDRPLKSYLYGMHAFGLAETNLVERAEKEARRGLQLNEHDGWATHALVHALEYTGRSSEGVEFLKKTNAHWKRCDIIQPHIEWHWALYELEQGHVEMAEEILFDSFLKKDSPLIMLDFVDAASLIYRLQLAGPSSAKVYSSTRLKNFLNEHLHDHVLLFNDLHIYFILDDDRAEFLRLLKETYESCDSDNRSVYREVGRVIFAALDAFEAKNYSLVVDLLYPIRQQIVRIGGSNAQRDLFSLLLIHSAVYSSNPEDQLLAKQLLNERCSLRNQSPSKMMLNHDNARSSQ